MLLDVRLDVRKKLASGPALDSIVGVPGTELEIAVVVAPGGHKIELLQYDKPDDRTIYRPRSCDVGSAHLTFSVTDIDHFSIVSSRLVGSVSARHRRTRNGMRVAYARGPEGHTIEMMQLPR